jgi:hypothetical protein
MDRVNKKTPLPQSPYSYSCVTNEKGYSGNIVTATAEIG